MKLALLILGSTAIILGIISAIVSWAILGFGIFILVSFSAAFAVITSFALHAILCNQENIVDMIYKLAEQDKRLSDSLDAVRESFCPEE